MSSIESTDAQRREDFRRSLLSHAATISVAFVVAASAVLANPFRFEEAAGQRGREIFYQVIAAQTRPPAAARAPLPGAVVVNIDDEFIRKASFRDASGHERKYVWPLSYEQHAVFLQAIAARKPAALFIDMPFVYDRDDATLGELIDVLEATSKTIPIFLAAVEADDHKPAIDPILDLVARDPNIHLVSVRRGASLGIGHAYPIHPSLNAESKPLQPAAVALYNAFRGDRSAFRPRYDTDAMDIWWTLPRKDPDPNKKPFNCRGQEVRMACDLIGANWFTWIETLTQAGFLSERPPGSPRLTIPATPTLSVRDLVLPGEDAAFVDDALKGKVVFYGSDLILMGDHEVSAVHGPLPGVQAHAAAYSNLADMEGGYITTAAPFNLNQRVHLAGLLLILCLAGFAARAGATWVSYRNGRPLKPDSRVFGYLDTAVLSTTAVTLAAGEFFLLHIGPISWFPVLLIAMAGDLLASHGLTASLLGLINRLPRMRAAPA
ncbi:CHASE2 domain-containing protein [Phenylobacterium sp.]|jgi:CHASE2 domain-containing sensor protein|uniref:CHASE2 domain-containing protein n=1 Tax=Phenylobacterium sp. TaxID=1871053 RepID=UPI002F3E673E